VNVLHFEHYVLAKPYFDRCGLLVAESVDSGIPIGFVHAGFGANEDCSDVSREDGVICVLQMAPEAESKSLAEDLLNAAEVYLRESGSRRLLGGPSPPQIPFYHGLFCSGELPGVLQADAELQDIFQSNGYSEIEQFAIMECQLGRMRGVFDRTQRMLPRAFEVRPAMDHVFDNWWETCAFGPTQRSEFQVIAKEDNAVCGSLVWWDVESAFGATEPGVAISRVRIVNERRRAGIATFLVSNALKQLKSSGAHYASVQVPKSNSPAIEFFTKLGFASVDCGIAYEKVL